MALWIEGPSGKTSSVACPCLFSNHQKMNLKRILIPLLLLLGMTAVFGQEKDEELIFQDQKDVEIKPDLVDSDRLGKYLVKKKHSGYQIIEQEGKLGVLNKSGALLIPPFVEGKIRWESNGFQIRHQGLFGFYDLEGNEILPPQYKGVYHKGKYIVVVASKSGLYDARGKQVLDTAYCVLSQINKAPSSDRELYKISKDCKNFAIVAIDTLQSDLIFDYQSFQWLDHADAYFVKKKDQFGVMDYDLEAIVPLEYEVLKPYRGYLIAKKNGQYGIIDYSNQEIIPFAYEQLESGEMDDFIVRKNGKYGSINLHNEIQIPLAYNNLRFHINVINAYLFTEKGKQGLMSFSGKIILPPKYEEIRSIIEVQADWTTRLNKGYILSNEKGKFAISNADGEVLTDFIYDRIKPKLASSPFPLTVKLGEYLFKMDRWGACVGDCPPKEVLDAARSKN